MIIDLSTENLRNRNWILLLLFYYYLAFTSKQALEALGLQIREHQILKLKICAMEIEFCSDYFESTSKQALGALSLQIRECHISSFVWCKFDMISIAVAEHKSALRALSHHIREWQIPFYFYCANFLRFLLILRNQDLPWEHWVFTYENARFHSIFIVQIP